MKQTTNKLQRNYMMAKTIVAELEERELEIEREYISAHKITNPDGETPRRIFCIDDEATFDTASAAVADRIDGLGLYESKKTLREAEDQLINFALSICPAREREVLRKPCFGLDGDYIHLDVREKVLNLVLRLDVSTVRA